MVRASVVRWLRGEGAPWGGRLPGSAGSMVGVSVVEGSMVGDSMEAAGCRPCSAPLTAVSALLGQALWALALLGDGGRRGPDKASGQVISSP